MKILIIQEKGRHLKNQEFREALNFKRAFDRMGVDCVVWGLNYDNFNLKFEDVSKDCDVILLLENYEMNGWIPNLSNFKGLKLFWSIDSHCALSSHLHTCNTHKIDIVLNAIESHGRAFDKTWYYFPVCYPHDLIYYKPHIEKNVNVGFCGNYVNRAEWINCIPDIKKDIFVIGDDMVNTINSYKIHFNRNMSNDINYRTFETMGCKTLLITNETENLKINFNIDKHMIIYKTKDELLDKIKYYVANDEERKKIELEGYEHVLSNHTYDNRVKELITIINKHI